MWIRMISTAAGPRLPHSLQSGHTYDVSEELGRELVEIRAAEEVSDPRPKKTEATAEVAAVDDGEKATLPGTEKKAESLMDQLTKQSQAEPEADGKTDPKDEADASDDANDSADASKKKSAKAAAKKS